jgi:bifunctional non-homologous end joining protein LigD
VGSRLGARKDDWQKYTVGGLIVSHPDKIWWPDEGITKLDIVRYYNDVEPRLRPWMKDRLLTAERCPDGMRGSCFYQKDFARGLPAGVSTEPVRAETTGKVVRYVVGGSRRTLLALVNLGCIPIHVMNCRRGALDQPDWLAFDLDPGSGRFADAVRAGMLLRAILDDLGLTSYPKTSGARGLHVLIPLRPGPGQDEVRNFAMHVGRLMASRAPRLVTVEMSKRARRGRVFADVLRNAFGQTIVAPYAVRRRPRAPISTPLAWDEVDPKLDPADFNLKSIERRLAAENPWDDFWRRRQRLPRVTAGRHAA